MKARLGGIWAAVTTPLDADVEPDAAKAAGYYARLLADGCDGVNVLGTTGEGMSFDAEQRLRFMQALADAGLDRARVMAGTGAASLGAAVRLTREALDLGFAAALVMPPFFFRDAAADGILRFFDALFARVAPPPASILLYNFPRMSGITFHPALVDRLYDAFPHVIAGIKDSSNDRALQADVARRHPELAVFAGAENYLDEVRAYGGSGCISGSVALWPALAKAAFEGDADAVVEVRRLREEIGTPLIPRVRERVARERGDPSWERCVPPL